jgi:hypothetical protein
MPCIRLLGLLAGSVLIIAVNNSALADRKLQVPDQLKGTTEASQVSLNWSNISGETGFLVERRLISGGSFAEIGKTVADVTNYKDTLTTADQYEYRVRAYRSTGSNLSYSDYTNVVDVAPVATTVPDPGTATTGDVATSCP